MSNVVNFAAERAKRQQQQAAEQPAAVYIGFDNGGVPIAGMLAGLLLLGAIFSDNDAQ